MRRILRAILLIYAVSTITFFLVRLMPGNIVDRLVLQYMTQGIPEYEARQMVASLLGIDFSKPLHEQYIEYLFNLLRGDLGTSYEYMGVPVASIIMYGLPWTVFLLSLALTTSFIFGILIGGFIGYREGSKLDRTLTILSMGLQATPNYIVGILLLYYLAFVYRMFPRKGAYDIGLTPSFTWEFISNVLWHSTLPFLAYFITSFGIWALNMRASTIRVLGEDYVMAAEARGLRDKRIAITYVARNALLAPLSLFIISVGYIFGGSVFIESIFTYPGIGWYITHALGTADYPVLQGCFLLITISVIVANSAGDIIYSLLDPRVRVR